MRSQVQSVDNKNNVIYSQNRSDFGPKEIRLIGDSLVKHVIPGRLIRESDVKVIKHDTYHLGEIKSLIDSENSGFKNVDVSAIHCGTNDIKEQTADTCLEKMKAIVDSLQTVNPTMKINPSDIVPRGDNEISDINWQELNVKLLKEYNLNPRITFCDHNNLARNGSTANQFYAVDKIHLNENGTKVLASNISTAVKNVLRTKPTIIILRRGVTVKIDVFVREKVTDVSSCVVYLSQHTACIHFRNFLLIFSFGLTDYEIISKTCVNIINTSM